MFNLLYVCCGWIKTGTQRETIKMSSELSVKLNTKILAKLDEMIDGKKIKNRSDAVEFLITKTMGANKVKKAVILAGGKGTRMRPFTYEIPKPLIPIHGKPLLQHIIELLRKYEIREIILSVGYMGDNIKEHFGNGHNLGVTITYIEEEEKLGTAGSLNLMKDLLDETFIMFNGDILINIDLHDIILFHKRSGGLATIALKPVKDPSRFGVARLKGDQILEFLEKPKSTKSRLINAGVYVLEPEAIDYVPEGVAMMETDVFPKLAEKGELYGYPFDGQWFDTGTHRAYEKAIKEWRDIK